jgi:hypothetical protein
MVRLGPAAGVAAVLCLAALAGAAFAARPAQRPASDPHGFSGLWMNDNTLDERLKREGRHRLDPGEADGPGRETPSLTPQYQALLARMRAGAPAEGAASCRWVGLPGIMTYPYPFEILATPGRLTFIFETDSQVRRIWLDRSRHLDADELDPSYYGDSIGHWEGGALVIDTIGFNTQTTVNGVPHSEQMHVVERLTRRKDGRLEDRMTITDPQAFTRPFVQTIVYARRPGWRIREYSCNENNRDTPDASGRRSGGVVQPSGGP